jgi:hypothetical protein
MIKRPEPEFRKRSQKFTEIYCCSGFAIFNESMQEDTCRAGPIFCSDWPLKLLKCPCLFRAAGLLPRLSSLPANPPTLTLSLNQTELMLSDEHFVKNWERSRKKVLSNSLSLFLRPVPPCRSETGGSTLEIEPNDGA